MFPDKFKTAKVIPLYKTTDLYCTDNTRLFTIYLFIARRANGALGLAVAGPGISAYFKLCPRQRTNS